MEPFWFRAALVTKVGVPNRLGAIATVMLSVAGAFACAGGWLSPDRLTQDRMMAAFQDPTASTPASDATTQREFASPAGSKAAGRPRHFRKPRSSSPVTSRWLAGSRSL